MPPTTRGKNQPQGFYRWLDSPGSLDQARRPKQKPPRSGVYPVQVVDEDGPGDKVKIHFIGYGKSEDLWLEKNDVLSIQNPPSSAGQSAEGGLEWLIYNIKLEVKKGLNPGTRSEPIYKFRIQSERKIIEKLLECATATKNGYFSFTEDSADRIFGKLWTVRIINKQGDRYRAKNIVFRISTPPPVVEFIRTENGEFVEHHMKQMIYLLGKFVRIFEK